MSIHLVFAVSRGEFDRVYSRLGISVVERGESFYNSMLPSVVEELKTKGIMEEDAGAQIIRNPKFRHPLIAVKGDGGYGYDSTDLAAVRHRLVECGSSWLIYITDSGQADHFTMIFDAARRAEWASVETRLEHIGFGVVLGVAVLGDGAREGRRTTPLSIALAGNSFSNAGSRR